MSKWNCQECRDCGFLVKNEMIHLEVPCSRGCSPNIFECSICKQVFPKAWTDEEARAEYREKFRCEPSSETSVMCDNCVEFLETLESLGVISFISPAGSDSTH